MNPEIVRSKLFRYGLVITLIFISHLTLMFPVAPENPDSNFIYPSLSKFESVSQYLDALRNFETIDFQPVRDATLFLELFIQRNLGTNISIFLNLIVWSGCCLVALTIFDRFLKVVNEKTSLLLTLAFSVYPIFLQTINWGIARKHLLAFFFTLLATKNFLEWITTRDRQFRIVFYYTLSVLSLPISIALPVWFFCYLFLNHREKLKEARFLVILSLIMILLVAINLSYYNISKPFLALYPKKVQLISLQLILVNLGHQFWQMIWPYRLSFYHTFGDTSVIGIILFFLALFYLVIKKRMNAPIWTWILFAGSHMVIILTTPGIYYDPYILIPSFALMVILAHLFAKGLDRRPFLLLPLIIFWTGFTLAKNKIWENSESFYSNNFSVDRNCSNAIGLGFTKYANGKKNSNELYDYIQVNQCLVPSPYESPAMQLKKILFEALSLYYEDEVPQDYREKRLIELSRLHFFPYTVYLTLLSQEGRDKEIEEGFAELNEMFGETQPKIGKEMVPMKVLPAYCEARKLTRCMEFMKAARESED